MATIKIDRGNEIKGVAIERRGSVKSQNAARAMLASWHMHALPARVTVVRSFHLFFAWSRNVR
jgi:hypothetical protein